jgi:phage pi2 protein 07
MKMKEILENLSKEKNSNWVGSNVKERGKHYRQESKKGPASKYSCKESGCENGKHMEWAQLKGSGWRAMCKSCHSKYDKKSDNINKGRKK